MKVLASSIAVLFTVLAPIVFSVLYEKRKGLEFEVTSSSSVVGGAEIDHGIRVVVGGLELRSAYLQQFKFENVGRLPIAREDYERDITIAFDGDVHSAREKNEKPKNINVSVYAKNDRINIKPVLLNPGDSFEVEAITSTDISPEVNARISGLREVTIVDKNSETMRSQVKMSLVWSLLMISYGVVASFSASAIVYKKLYGTGLISFLCCISIGVAVSKAEEKISWMPESEWFYLVALIPTMILSFIMVRRAMCKKDQVGASF